ncbi:hypothetical protein IMCC3317_40340 [Kordia antarctica]|uniref:Uncharacterized protein n=1 Tax=Kordia antarctica TaxID=1218801 RepID=A0A7L4ZQ56_9FLAO|nr:hypothetical protein [Kordia antarctica]QHI38640.1 hypothetical protein IMCC3317_40340 [Kordia antarctica]
MKLLKSLDKLLASMGNISSMERTHIDTHTENKMQEVAGEQLATSEHGGIWAALQELNGYVFMEVTVLGTTKIKTLKGVTLTFLGDNELTLTSDSYEINSDFSNVSTRWMTAISFEITKKDLNFIQKKKFNQVRLDFKKKSLLFDAKK